MSNVQLHIIIQFRNNLKFTQPYNIDGLNTIFDKLILTNINFILIMKYITI